MHPDQRWFICFSCGKERGRLEVGKLYPDTRAACRWCMSEKGDLIVDARWKGSRRRGSAS